MTRQTGYADGSSGTWATDYACNKAGSRTRVTYPDDIGGDHGHAESFHDGTSARHRYYVICWMVASIAGCNPGSPTPTQEYFAFVSRSGGTYVPRYDDTYVVDPHNGKVSIWFSPRKYGVEIQGLSIKNVLAPEGSEVDVSNPSSAKGEQWIILTVSNVNTAKADWHIAWDIYQGTDRKQTIHVVITPPPEVRIMIDG